MNNYSIETMTDYTTYAYESCIDTLKYYQALEVTNMKVESDFILGCLESGYIDMHYEIDPSLVATTESILSSLKQAISNFFKKLGELFSGKAKELSKKYKNWIDFAEGKILERAKNMKLDMFPYINANWEKDANLISTKAKEAMSNYQSGTYNYKYMSPFVSLDTKGETQSMKVKLENYFKFNRKDSLGIKGQTRYAGQDLVKVVSTMCDYVKNYDTKVLNVVGNCCQDIADTISSVDTEGTNESLTPDTFISVEGKYLCETDLISTINYPDVITEARKNKSKKGNIINKSDENKSEFQNDKGEEVNANDVSVSSNDDKSDTAGKTEDKSTTGTKETPNNATGAEGEESGENKQQTEYLKKTESLLKLLTSTYTTACEQRYLAYIVALKAIGDGSGAPKFDKDGNWIQPSKEEEMKNNTQIADNNKTGKKSVAQGIKDFFSTRKKEKEIKKANKKAK